MIEKTKGDIKMLNIRRGDIYYADLSPVVGSEQGGLRPVLIVQNDVGNRYSPTVIAAAITSKLDKARLPTHIDVYADEVGLSKDSVILLEQIRTLDKKRLKEKMGHLDDGSMRAVNSAIAVSFGLSENEAALSSGNITSDYREIASVPNMVNTVASVNSAAISKKNNMQTSSIDSAGKNINETPSTLGPVGA